MNSKFKKICVAITTLILSLSMSLESFADTHYNGDQGGGGSNHSKYENYASSRPSIWLDYPNQGLRLYVTNNEGTLIPTDSGTEVLDFLYNTSISIQNPRHLRSVKYDKGNYSSQKLPMSDLGFDTITKNNYYHEKDYFKRFRYAGYGSRTASTRIDKGQ